MLVHARNITMIVSVLTLTVIGCVLGPAPSALAEFQPFALETVERSAYGVGTGQPATIENTTEIPVDGGWIPAALGGVTMLALIATAFVAFHLSRIRDNEGNAQRKFTVGTKLALSMGGLTTLLLALGTVSMFAQKNSEHKSIVYYDIVGDQALLDNLQANVLMVRMNVKDFLLTNSDKDLQQYSDYIDAAYAYLDVTDVEVKNPERVEMLRELRALLDAYDDSFHKTVDAIDARNGIFSSQIGLTGDVIRDGIKTIADNVIEKDDVVLAEKLRKAADEVYDARLSGLKYLRSGQQQYADNTREQLAAARVDFEQLRTRFEGASQDAVDDVLAALSFYDECITKMIAQKALRDDLVSNSLDVIGPQIAALGSDLSTSIHATVSELKAANRAASAQMSWVVSSVVVIAVILSTGASVFLIRGLTIGMTRVVQVMRRIAAGDLTGEDINSTAGDEVGQLSRACDRMSDSLKTLVNELVGVGRDVAAASTEIAATADQTSNGMAKQQVQTQQVASAVEEMNSTVREIADKGANSSRRATDAVNSAREGGEVVKNTVDEMGAIASDVAETSQVIEQLGVKSQQIGEIISVINDIADQTNLLALNAAIEAARAGEHGRGFAVVADEVRKLAERTTQATGQVSDSIRAVQIETDEAVRKINTGSERVTKGVELANQAGEALQLIETANSEVGQMVESIAAASEQQAAASEQISRSISAVADVSKESAAGAGQAAQASKDLSMKAEKLNHLISQFQLA
ncbi:MAG: methyl-accepting chemotaxis protein [Planctomycetota bacterium]